MCSISAGSRGAKGDPRRACGRGQATAAGAAAGSDHQTKQARPAHAAAALRGRTLARGGQVGGAPASPRYIQHGQQGRNR